MDIRQTLRGMYPALLMVGALACTDSSAPDREDFTTPGTLVVASGDNQTASAGQPFTAPLRVIVFTPSEKKCNGCTVEWTLTPGGFSQGPVVTRTVVTGEAAINISSLSPAGQYTVTASLANGSAVRFTLRAL